MDLTWMAWTTPTAIFFAVIGAILVTMTALEIVRPTVERKGFMPMPTTRGDRLFLSLLTAAFIHLAYVYGTDAALLWTPLGISVAVAAVIMAFG